MSFKFPSLKSIQDTISNYDFESFSKLTGKTYEEFSKTIQPFTHKTSELLSQQLTQIQQFANNNNSNIEVSELPADYLELESNCDLLLKLYTDLIHFTNDTFNKVSYDYPPANNSIKNFRENVLGNKFQQLKNVSSPQELENLLLGKEPSEGGKSGGGAAAGNGTANSIGNGDDKVDIQVIEVPKTLYGQLSKICEKYQTEMKNSDSPLNFTLLQISSTYLEIATSRLAMDKKIINNLNLKLVEILNKEFIKVNELRKKVYSLRLEFDLIRSKTKTNGGGSTSANGEEEEENEELIKIEDDLVNATEIAVTEMKNLIKPSKSVNLLKLFIEAQKEWFELSAKKLDALASSLDKIKFD